MEVLGAQENRLQIFVRIFAPQNLLVVQTLRCMYGSSRPARRAALPHAADRGTAKGQFRTGET